jgi:uncharacterized protein
MTTPSLPRVPAGLEAFAGALPPEPDTEFAGYVLGTERNAATPLDFWVYVDPTRYLQLDDVVHVRSPLPDGQTVDVYGVVDEVRATQEGVRFASDVALTRAGVLPAETAVAAHVSVTRVEPEIFVPPLPGQPVAHAHGEAREQALFFDQMKTRIPLGVSRAGEPVLGNFDFLNGTRGAHVNISGISGVATKTSYAMFLLYGLLQGGALGAEAHAARSLVFNVKGEDLLFLDRPNSTLSDVDRERYAALGLPARPFDSVAFFAPAKRLGRGAGGGRGSSTVPDTGARMEGVTGFYWTIREFCTEGYLRFLFADADDDRSQIGYVVGLVATQLQHAARASRGGQPSVDIGGATVSTFDDLVEAIAQQTDPDQGGMWASRAAAGTVHAFLRRLEAAAPHVGHLIRGDAAGDDATHRVDWTRTQVTVLDLNRLHDRAQRFVVGVVLKRMFEERLASGHSRPLTFVVLDELNKYAPREGSSPIKDVLLDIAERGRSLGVVLIGAQQTASEVESRVVANCSFRVVGRLDAAEAQRSEYGFLTQAARARASLLKPGSLILQQPDIPVPLLVQFPRPAWATRPSEVPELDDATLFGRFKDAPGTEG